MHHITDGLKFLFTNILQHINSRNISDHVLIQDALHDVCSAARLGVGDLAVQLSQHLLQANTKKDKLKKKKQLKNMQTKGRQTRQSKQCGFSIYTFDNLKSNSMVRLVRAEKMVLSGLVFARKIARMILIQNI